MRLLVVTLAGWGYDEWDRWHDVLPYGMEYVPLWAEGVTGPRGIVMEAPLLVSSYTGVPVAQLGKMDVWCRYGGEDAVGWPNLSTRAVWNGNGWRWELCNIPFTWPADKNVGGMVLPGMPMGQPWISDDRIPVPAGWPAAYDLALVGDRPDPVEWRNNYKLEDMGRAIQSVGTSARQLAQWFVLHTMDADVGWIGYTFPHRLFTLWNQEIMPTWDSVYMTVMEVFRVLLTSDLRPERLLVYSPWGWEPGKPVAKGFMAWSGFTVPVDGPMFQYDVAGVVRRLFGVWGEEPDGGVFR